MLCDIDLRISRNEFHESPHPVDDLVCVTVCALEVGIVDDVIQHDDHVPSKTKCIVLRSHLASVRCSSLLVSDPVCLVVVVTHNRIERNACAHDLLLVHIQDLDSVPTDVSESETYGNAVKAL